MVLIVTSLGESLDSPVDSRFGRARFLVCFEAATGQWSVDNNQAPLVPHAQAGVQTARRVMARGAEAVVTGHCGPQAFHALCEAGIAVYGNASGSVAEALALVREGKLEKMRGPDVSPGYGIDADS